MFEIKGKRNTAICYATLVEEEAIEQIRRMCDSPAAEGSRIRIMPDVHAGKGCTIGTTMTIVDKVVPNIVGVDIGCGMYTIKLGRIALDFAVLDAAAHEIPSGRNVWEQPMCEVDLSQLRCYKGLKNHSWLTCSLGTLGGGNHFIEVDEAEDGTLYLIIHSGSRNLGKQVAEYYQKKAIQARKGSLVLQDEHDRIIREYKEQGKSNQIQAALQELKRNAGITEAPVPDDLCWLEGADLEDYLHDAEFCQAFARRNREQMAKILLEKTGLTGMEAFHTIHNYVDTRERILRKGAIAAHAGEKILIPINMRDGSVLAIGRGSEEWNYSAPHGAGRIMSRTKAKNSLDLEEYREAMQGVYTTSVSAATLDEAPMAYKSLQDIIGVIQDTVDIVDIMRPVYNFKAAE